MSTRTALRELEVGRPPARRAGLTPRGLQPQKGDSNMSHRDVENDDGNGNTNGLVDAGQGKPMSNGSCKPTEGDQGAIEPPVGPAAVEFEYIQSDELQDVSNPRECVSTLMYRLDSKDWTAVSEALNNVRQLAVYRKTEISHLLDKIVGLILKSMKNPRSTLCKTAIMAMADLFRCFGDEILDQVDSVLLQLLLKASQDKRFVCEEAEKTLCVMTQVLSPTPVLHKLLSYATHVNPRVRAKATVSVYSSAARLDPVGIVSFGLPALLRVAGAQVTDRLPEARDSARKLAGLLHAAHRHCLDCECAQKAWEEMCTNHLSSNTAQTIIRLTSVPAPPLAHSSVTSDEPSVEHAAPRLPSAANLTLRKENGGAPPVSTPARANGDSRVPVLVSLPTCTPFVSSSEPNSKGK